MLIDVQPCAPANRLNIENSQHSEGNTIFDYVHHNAKEYNILIEMKRIDIEC